MNINKIPFTYAFFLAIGLLFLTACDRENMDETNIFPDDVDPDIVEVDVPTTCAEPYLILESPFLNYEMEAEAVLYIGDVCSGGASDKEYSYLIYQSDFDFGGNQDKLDLILDGFPAISFGSNSILQPGDIVEPFIAESLFRLDFSSPGYIYDQIDVGIEEAGDEVGEFLIGTFTGLLVDQNNQSNIESVSGSFCVELVEVCE